VLRFTSLREDAEDIVQESFHKAFVHLHRFEAKSSFSTWLARTAINEALMLLRRSTARAETNSVCSNEPVDPKNTKSHRASGPSRAIYGRDRSCHGAHGPGGERPLVPRA
jgi:RNA polymerase sigma factor (sigma-70 family)